MVLPTARPLKPALFITCVVDMLYPQVGEAMVRVLRRAGCEPTFNPEQTCCGQPSFNAGFVADSRELAKRFIALFENADAVVIPSGSCASMIKVFYPQILAAEALWHRRAQAMAAKTYEFTEYLVNVLELEDVGARFPARVAYHESCHLSRMLGIKDPPRRLLSRVQNLTLCELEGASECCGFGGSFAVKFADISCGIVDLKLAAIAQSGADVVTASDMGCLMHIAGALSRQNVAVRALHIAEILAGG